MLQLYHHTMSASSRYIRLILAEYGQQAEFREERPWERREEFLQLNPAASLPVLVDHSAAAEPVTVCGGVIAGEYLDETCGAMMRDRRLMPEKSAARAEVRRLIEWFLVKMDGEALSYLVHERVFKQLMRGSEGAGPPDSAVIRAARSNLKSHLRYAGWLAGQRNWLAGPSMTAADLAAAAALSVPDYLGEIPWDAEPELREWYARIKSRPSFRPLLTDKVAGLPPASHYIDLDF